MQFSNMDGHIKAPKVQYLFDCSFIMVTKGGHRRITQLIYFNYLRSQSNSVWSGHLNKALYSVTWATLNSTILSLDFFSHEIENLSNPPVECEAKIDTDYVQTLCNLHKTIKIKEIL